MGQIKLVLQIWLIFYLIYQELCFSMLNL